jgi:hypothetical protein
MRAALRGRLANGVITDEETAQLLIAADKDSVARRSAPTGTSGKGIERARNGADTDGK